MRCGKRGFEEGRDMVAVLNIRAKALEMGRFGRPDCP